MKFRNPVLILFFLIGLAPFASCFSNDTLYYLEDPDSTYTSKEVLNKFIHSPEEFKSVQKAINIRFETSKIWVVLDEKCIKNNDVLLIQNAFLDHIYAYFYHGNREIEKQKSGDSFKYNSRSFDHVSPNFEIPDNTNLSILYISTTGPMKVPVKLFTYKEFIDDSQQNASFHFFYFGVITITILLSIFVYSWLTNSIFLYYALSVFGTMSITASNYGYLFKYFWPENPVLNQYSIAVLALAVFNVVFVEKLLNLRKNHKVLFKIFRIYYAFFVIIMLCSAIIRNNFLDEALFLSFCIFPFLPLVAGIAVYRKVEFYIILYFYLGVIAFFGSIGVYVLLLNGLLPVNVMTDNSIQFGSLIEILCFNIALVYKVKSSRAKQQEILIKEKSSLEKKVLSRTMELTLKNKLIEEKNQQLESQQELLEKKVEKRTTELLKTNKELNDRNFRLEQFANVTAHNLRGPVATLLGLCNIFNMKDTNDPLNLTIIKNIQESATKVDGILRDLSTLLDHHQNAESMVEEIQLDSIFMQVMHILKIDFEKSGGKISTEFSQAPSVNTVPVYIKNIFYNLISNGLKYKRQNYYPEIEIRSYSKDHFVCLEFKDKGIGIDLDKFGEKLFQPYQRFHISFPGKGLGLYTCKTQIESMGGKIEVDSEVGSGTTFTIFLPDKKPLEDKELKSTGKEQEKALS